MIVSGELKAGQALPPERQLAQMLEISRPTLRQAISALAATNIVESRHGGGTFVTALTPDLLAAPLEFLLQIDPKAVAYLFDVRRGLEVNAAQLSATRITPVELIRLRELINVSGESIDDLDLFIEHDKRLHRLIVASIHNPIYDSLCSSVERLSDESRRRSGANRAVRVASHDDHIAIVEALEAHDPDLAAEAMRRHLAHVEDAAANPPARNEH
jgi:GntR family transcriptional repressor for pyruvate dehydrogenase complex